MSLKTYDVFIKLGSDYEQELDNINSEKISAENEDEAQEIAQKKTDKVFNGLDCCDVFVEEEKKKLSSTKRFIAEQ